MDKLEQYWASIEDHKELLNELDGKIKAYYDDLRETGLLHLYERSFRAYYGGRVSGFTANTPLFEGSSLKQGGRQGEKTRLKVNHYRNFIRHLHQLTTAQKPTVQARASNSDYKSQSQTMLANGLLDYYWREKSVGDFLRDAVEVSLVYSEAFVHAPWNPAAGEVFSTDPEGKPIYEGDQEYAIHNPLTVVRDPSLRSNDHNWHILKDQQNRWDLIAKYTAQREAILDASAVDPHADDNPSFQLRGGNEPINKDLVEVFTLYHKKSESMPQGRMVIFLKEAVLFDGPLPYQEPPVYRMAGEQLIGTIYGYTPAFDLLGIQEGMDELHTILMSNNKAFGVQSLWISDTDKMSVSDLTGGMRLLKSENEPKPIQLTKSAPETYDYLALLEKAGETLSGISSTVRGQPEASLKSGAALALVVSQSIQFASSLEKSYNRLVELIGTALITNLKTFSQTDRVANIIGESSRPFAKEFNADDLSQINRVVVEQASPLSKTVAGRVEIANNLLEQQFLKTPEQYLTVLTTGQLDPAIEGTQHELLNVRAENEEMRENKAVIAIASDNHALHIKEHGVVLQSPEARRNPQLVQTVLAHIQEHLDLWRTTDPAILMVTGQQPPPPPAMPGMMGPPPGQPPAPPPGAEQPVLNETAPIMQEVESVNPAGMPSMPENSPPEAEAAYETIL